MMSCLTVILAAILIYHYMYFQTQPCSPVQWKTPEDEAITFFNSMTSVECPMNFTLYQFTYGHDLFDVQVKTDENGRTQVSRCKISKLPYLAWNNYDVINETGIEVIRDACVRMNYVDYPMLDEDNHCQSKEETVVKVEEKGDTLFW